MCCQPGCASALLQSSPEDLSAFRNRSLNILSVHAGRRRRTSTAVFRNFPNGIPSDTLDLWWSKVLVHFLQADGQPCLFCRRNGTTHVLDPCQHVVCDRCFDGANYSACPRLRTSRGPVISILPPSDRGLPSTQRKRQIQTPRPSAPTWPLKRAPCSPASATASKPCRPSIAIPLKS